MTSYTDIPPLRAYIERIGAEELNFRKFMVRIYHNGGHYYSERAVIRVLDDGTIAATHREFEPTAEEALAIKEALQGAQYPRHINATEAEYDMLLDKLRIHGEPTIYKFYDRRSSDRCITMAQERCLINDVKAYVPWTMWDDGEWRRMEPEGLLPFWKPKERTGRSMMIMVHEGAKTADYVHRLCTDPEMADKLKDHPWGEELKKYEHWGMIGGALAPQRTDYAELSRETPDDVIYVCDNDWPGKAALKLISKYYGHKLKGIMFDERWPAAWDLADKMPQSMYGDDGRWMGPRLLEQTQPATWATEVVERAGAGRPSTQIRSEFAQDWIHCVTPEVFVHLHWPSKIYSAPEFNHVIRPFSSVDDTGRLLKAEAANRTAMLEYNPGREPGIYNDSNGNRYINTHTPSAIKATEGDYAPFIDFMERLIPYEEDRHEMLRWCATLIAKPENKMHYGVLLVSEVQGIGKSTLGEKILGPLVGFHNVSYPSENDIVESSFNYWAAHKRLAVVHEIYAGHSSKAYNKLKSVITDRVLTINRKFEATYEIENWMHIYACSNSPRALQLSTDDRRWFVPKLTQFKQPTDFWIEFNTWLLRRSGLGIIRKWAEEFVRTHKAVLTGEPAPWTKAKQEVIEEGYSTGMTLAAQFLAKAKSEIQSQNLPPDTFILDTDLVKMVQNFVYEGRQNERLEKPLTMRKIAKNNGWLIGERKVRIYDWGLQRQTARIISMDEGTVSTEPSELHANGRRPFDCNAHAQQWLGL